MLPPQTQIRSRKYGDGWMVAYVSLAFLTASLLLSAVLCLWQPWRNFPTNADSAFMVWALKWWPYSLMSGHNPFAAPFFAPVGQNLAWTGAVPALGLLMAPITFAAGPVFAYNLVVALALAANGIIAYLIARDINCKRIPSLCCAALFYLSSYTWGQLLGHLNLTVTTFSVAAIYLTLLRSRNRTGRKFYIIVGSILLALQFGTSNEIYATLVVFSVLAFAVFAGMFWRLQVRRELIAIGCDMAIVVVMSLVLVSPYLYEIFSNHTTNLQVVSSYYGDPLNYVIPTRTNLLFGHVSRKIARRFLGNASEQGLYLGLPILLLLVTAGRRFYQCPLNRALLIVLLIIGVCSLGGRLTLLGTPTIWLPWAIAENLPLIREALPVRFGLYTSLVAALIVARLWTARDTYVVRALTIAAVLMLLPKLSAYAKSEVPIDAFFAEGSYKAVIHRSENVLVLPTYGFGGYQAAWWQAEADFSFDLVNGLAGKVPSAFARYGWYYYGGALPGSAQLGLIDFMDATDTNVVLSDSDASDPVSELFRALTLPATQYGPVVVTKISRPRLRALAESLRQPYVVELCRSLRSLSQYGIEYKDAGGDPSDLTPGAVSDPEFEREFGRPLPTGTSAKNWTSKGYWLGTWNGMVAVGVSPLDAASAGALYREVASASSHIFFPYPRTFRGESPKAAYGQFLAILKPRASGLFQCPLSPNASK